MLKSLVSEWGEKHLHEISIQDVDVWWARLRSSVGPSTANKHLYRIKHVYMIAERWELVHTNPVRHIRKLREPRGRVRYLTPDQREAILTHASPELRAYVIATRETGARLGTLHGMTRQMVDLESGEITFPKTKNGEPHMVPITSRMKALLDELNVGQMAMMAHVLPRRVTTSISRDFRLLTRSLGIKDFRFHDLLHDACTALTASGANARVVQAFRGHLDPRMTARYSHVPPDVLRRVMEAGLG